jgi:hypothetical protein
MTFLGKLLCRLGIHKWGKAETDAGKVFAFGMGHHVKRCQRDGCDWCVRWR